jgi:uncharacterized protein
MQFAVNYSHPTADLLQAGTVEFDRFKCPAWPDLVAQARAIHSTYVHFPLRTGNGEIIDTEKHQPIDWSRVDSLLGKSDTPFVNVHFSPLTLDFPDIDKASMGQAEIEQVVERTVQAIEILKTRYGRERIIVENIPAMLETILDMTARPEVITQVIEAADVGILFDLSHARLAANELGIDAKDYFAALPLDRIKEMHVTGIQRIKPEWVEALKTQGIETGIFELYTGRLIDHLPFTDDDWLITEWAFDQIKPGGWQVPELVSLEYGGVGGVWEAIVDEDVLREQVPRLYEIIHQERSTEPSA